MDPLITELLTASKTAESDILPSIVEALAAVARSAGKNIGAPVKENLMELIEEAFDVKTPGESRSTLLRSLRLLICASQTRTRMRSAS